MPVEVLAVQKAPGHEARRLYTGTLRSRRQSLLGFERGGRVVDLRVDEGARVRPGQLLGRLDTAQLRVRQRQLEAALAESKALRGISRVTNRRLEALASDAYASEQAYDEARFSLARAEAATERMEAELEAIRVDLRKSRLRAPFGGTVSARLVDEGTVVSAGTPVLRFKETEGQEAVVGVPAAVARRFHVSDRQELQVGGQAVQGVLDSRVDDMDPTTRTVLLVFRLETDHAWVDGELVRMEVHRFVEESGFWMPLGALTEGVEGLWAVYRVLDRPEGTIVRKEAVEVLYVDSDRVFARGTLEDGDQIVVEGLHRVVPGQRVEVLESERKLPRADVELEVAP